MARTQGTARPSHSRRRRARARLWRFARARCKRRSVSDLRSIYAPGLFDGQVAVITGGGTGIGLACAREMAFLGAKIAILGRRADRIEAARASLREDGFG